MEAVPESVAEAVNRTSNHFEEFRAHFTDFLPQCDAHTLSELDPLQRAQSLLLLANATTTPFTCLDEGLMTPESVVEPFVSLRTSSGSSASA